VAATPQIVRQRSPDTTRKSAMLTKRARANNIRKMPNAVSQVTAQMALLPRFQQFQAQKAGCSLLSAVVRIPANPSKSESMKTSFLHRCSSIRHTPVEKPKEVLERTSWRNRIEYCGNEENLIQRLSTRIVDARRFSRRAPTKKCLL
jgi:hypothetical protein